MPIFMYKCGPFVSEVSDVGKRRGFLPGREVILSSQNAAVHGVQRILAAHRDDNRRKIMGLTYATIHLTNLFNRQQITVNALVNTGATFLCVTEEIALQLGFDITEVGHQVVTLADGHQRKVPKIAPVEIGFENRSYITEAVVLGDEPLLGVLPLEAMDLVVDPRLQQLVPNPRHPNYPVALAK